MKVGLSQGRIVATLRRGYAAWAKHIVGLAVFASLGAILEVTALGLLVVVARTIADGVTVVDKTLPIFGAVHVATSTLSGLGVMAVMLRLLVQALVARGDSAVASRFMATMRNDVFSAFIQARWDEKSKIKGSDLQTLLTSNVDRAMHLLQSLTSGIMNICSICILLGSALLLSWQLALSACVTTVVMFLALRPLSLYARKLDREDAHVNLEYADRVTESVHLAKELEVFCVGGAVENRVAHVVERTRRKHEAALFAGRLLAPVYGNAVLLLGFVVLFVVAMSGQTRIEILGTVVAILLRVTAYTAGLQSVYHHVVGKAIYLEQILNFLDDARAHRKADGDTDPPPLQQLVLRNVSFRYNQTQPLVLQHVDFAVRKGEMLGIAGPSGSGKSTLTKLLLGLYHPTEGAIEFNDVNLERLKRTAWSRRIAYVPQEPVLMAGTIADNVRFMRDGITDADIERACRDASIHDVIAKLQDGYGTDVGDRGADLSVGQRQRICIARALVTAPEVVILDEPTSALDAHSEQAISRALDAIRHQTTLIIIAHRLSTLETCDRVLILDQGLVDGLAPPRELAKSNAFYRDGRAILGVGAA